MLSHSSLQLSLNGFQVSRAGVNAFCEVLVVELYFLNLDIKVCQKSL